MRWNYAMMSPRVILLVEEEEADVDGAERVGGTADPDRLDWNYASLRLIVAASIAPITEKWLDKGKGIEKLRKILVIVEGKISLSWVAESLYISMIERMKWEGKSILKCSVSESKNRARDSVIKL